MSNIGQMRLTMERWILFFSFLSVVDLAPTLAHCHIYFWKANMYLRSTSWPF